MGFKGVKFIQVYFHGVAWIVQACFLKKMETISVLSAEMLDITWCAMWERKGPYAQENNDGPVPDRVCTSDINIQWFYKRTFKIEYCWIQCWGLGYVCSISNLLQKMKRVNERVSDFSCFDVLCFQSQPYIFLFTSLQTGVSARKHAYIILTLLNPTFL